MSEQGSKKRYSTVKQISEYHPTISESAVRWWIFNEKENGFSRAVRRLGRKVLIDLDELEAWIDSHGGDAS